MSMPEGGYRAEQKKRLTVKVFRSGDKGKNERTICYEEQRYFDLGAEFTQETLAELVDEGVLRVEKTGPKRFRSVPNRERYQMTRYWYVSR